MATGAASPIGVGTYPDAIAITPDGTRAYVTNYTSNTVTPIDLATGRARCQIHLASNAGPAGIAITPDGTTAYVTDAGAPGTLGDTITPIDLATDKTEAPITVGSGPQGIAITPNGQRAYVADAGAVVSGQTGTYGSTVTPVDLKSKTALSPIKVGNAPIAVTITPDGSTALVANLNSGSVSPIDIANDTAGSPISVEGAPIAIAVSASDPTTAFVADSMSAQSSTGNVTPIDLSTDTAGAPIVVGKNPQAIAMSPDGTTAWVVCYDSETHRSAQHVDTQARRRDPPRRRPVRDRHDLRAPRRRPRRPSPRRRRSRATGSPHRPRRTTGVASAEGATALALGEPADATEAVTDASHRLYQVRVLLPELGPEAPDVDVHGPRPSEVLIAPHARQERLAREDLARVRGEEP